VTNSSETVLTAERCSLTSQAAPTTTIAERLRSVPALLSSGPPEMLTFDQQGSTLKAFGSAKRFLDL